MSKKTGTAFGRDEMNLLVGVSGGDGSNAGIGTAGTALLQSGKGFEQRKTKSNGEVDVASLTTAETAALLQQQQQSKGVPATTSRHRARRTQKRMQHHELLEQELMAQQQQYEMHPRQKQKVQPVKQPESESDEETDFAARQHKKKTANKRFQLEPQIVTQKEDAPQRRRRRRQRSSSSSSTDSEGSKTRQRRRPRKDSSSSGENATRRRIRRSPSASSSSSESSSEDERRQGRLQKRQQLAEEKKKKEEPSKEPADPTPKIKQPSADAVIPQQGDSKAKAETSALSKPRRSRKEESSTSASSECSGFSSESDSSSSSSDDEPAPTTAKPLFVPKRKRLQLAQEKLEAERAQKEHEENVKNQKEKRKKESRSLVAQVVAAGTTGANDDVVSEDEAALASRMLDDQDNKEEEKERDLWEVRELERLLTEIDRLRQKKQEEAEYRRRQQLTDEQARAEDIASGRYQQPGSNHRSVDKSQAKYQQRYFHRGAYYMDEDEFEEDDVRRKAKEYEQGVTESTKSRGDTRDLPKVMQVKQFGHANQSRYQGLSKEDTSSKESSTLLPLVHQKKQRKTTDIPTHKRNQDRD